MSFGACEICGAARWLDVHRGRVRDGVFGAFREDTAIAQCGGCGVQRLQEAACMPQASYEGEEYRAKLQNGLNSEAYFEGHDAQQIHTLRVIWPQNLRRATVADIGCGGGSLLDHLRGWTRRQIAIEPYDVFRRGLESRGYHVYPYAHDAVRDWGSEVDVAFSVQVIEHATNPREFLEQIRPLLKADGRLIISTPNLRDVLFDLLPDDFPSFFYRVVHRWYFDADSLSACARLAGFEVAETRYIHRYGMSNMLRWLRDRQPTGNARIDAIGRAGDEWWTSYLESIGRSDCVYLTLRPAESATK